MPTQSTNVKPNTAGPKAGACGGKKQQGKDKRMSQDISKMMGKGGKK